jgi:deoxyribodipyrimidine photo-lyase
LPPVPGIRVRAANRRPVRADGDHVVYWMIASRRTRRNFALQHAAWRARELGRPLVVLEPLRIGYPWACPRFHRFVLDGMRDNAEACAAHGVTYLPYVEPAEGAGRGLLAALAERACAVVTDEYPCFFLPRMVAAAAEALPVLLETVDGNGLLPLEATGSATIPREVRKRWPSASEALLNGSPEALAELGLEGPPPVAQSGGPLAARGVLDRFLRDGLARYGDGRNHPDDDAASGLSPYLHFGHISAHEVVGRVLREEDWNPSRLSLEVTGSRNGWWGVESAAESFLDEVITWREIGHVFSFHRPEDHDRFTSLPDWARATLAEHAGDPREHVYSLEELDTAQTHDRIWNAAQNELRATGRMHNYLRMLWGKKVLQWTARPEDAAAILIELNNRWALDGRDPNSYSGIFWVLGRFDRAWGPERPIFGKIRYMTSENTAKKLRLREYLARWAEPAEPNLFSEAGKGLDAGSR